MDFGIALAPSADAWKVVKRAEACGFSHAWFYDTQLLCADVFVSMAAAALQTTRIRLGTGVLIPSNRIAPVAANALASLNQLAPGRIDFGVGTGFTGRRTMGLGAMRLGQLREYVRVVRGLLAEETVEWEFEGLRRKIRFLNPEVGAFNTRDPIPLHVSAFGPKGRALAAETAEGWLTFMFGIEGALADIGAVFEACRANGRDPESLYSNAFTLGCVLAEGEACDGPRAKAQAGPQAACLLHSFVEAEERGSVLPLPPALKEPVAAYRRVYQGYQPPDARYLTLHRGHLLFLRPDEEAFVGGDLIQAVTFTGTREELRERIRALRDAGYRQWTIQLVPGHEDAVDEWADVVAKV
jgi:5,10-methylenetetrahydromethanopterin reductase